MHVDLYYKTHSVTHFLMFLGDYALMLAHLGVRSYGPNHLSIPVTRDAKVGGVGGS